MNPLTLKIIKILLLAVSAYILVILSINLYEDLKTYSLEKEIYDEGDYLLVQAEKEKKYSVVSVDGFGGSQSEYFVIDVREREEFDQGRIKGSKNYRLGDILGIEELRNEILNSSEGKNIIFFCHDGERSKIAADSFGKQDNRKLFVFEDAFDELRESDDLEDIIWDGTLKRVLPKEFREISKKRGYKLKDIDKIETGFIIDISAEKIDVEGKLEGKNILHTPVVKMTSRQVDKLLNETIKEPFSIICNSKLSCFYAKVVAYRMDQKGELFQGYYFWE